MKFPSNVNIATFNCSVFKWLDSQHLWNKIFHHLINFSGGIFWTTNQIEAILSQRHNIMTRITTNNIFKINAPKKTYYHIHRFSPTLVKCSLFRRRVPANPHWLRSWHHGIDDDCWRAAKVTRSELMASFDCLHATPTSFCSSNVMWTKFRWKIIVKTHTVERRWKRKYSAARESPYNTSSNVFINNRRTWAASLNRFSRWRHIKRGFCNGEPILTLT